LIIAVSTSYYARHKGRDPVGWFILGALLGIFAPLILLFLPTIKSEETGLPTLTDSTSDSFHSSQQPLPIEKEAVIQEEDKLWYYLDQDHQQIGPVSVFALRELWNRGKLNLNQYVWCEGMEKWEKVDNLPVLKSILNKLVPR
jgi:hypothetical protein